MSSILHGFIHCFSQAEGAQAYNQAVLERLPVSGALLTRPLFSLTPNARGQCYYGHLVHFAAYYKDAWNFEDGWLIEFESLLQQLFWDSAEVIHTYSGERRSWQSQGTQAHTEAGAINIQQRQRFASYHPPDAS